MRKINASEVIVFSKLNRFHMMVFCWCFFFIAFDGYDVAMFGVGLSSLMEDWNLSPVQAGAIGSYSLAGMMLGALILAPLSDRIGKKKILTVCVLFFSIFNVLAGFAHNATFFTIMRFLAAIGMGAVMPIAISLMTEFSPKKSRAILVAAMFCGYSLGGISASLIGIYLLPTFGWRILYWIAIIPVFTLPFFFKKFPESISYLTMKNLTRKISEILKKVDPKGNYENKVDYYSALSVENTKGFPISKLFQNNRSMSTIAFWLAVSSCYLMVFGLNTWLPKIMQESGYALTSSLTFNIVLSVGQIAGSLLGGYLADRYGYKVVLVSLYSIGSICFVALALSSNIVFLYILIAIGGACTVGAQNLANPYISEYYPKELSATGMGWASGMGRIGSMIAPSLVGFILVLNIAPQQAFLVFVIPSIVAAISFFVIQEKYGSFDKKEKDLLKEDKRPLNRNPDSDLIS